MIEGYGPITQACLGTLFTWGLTAAGAGLVVVFKGAQRKLLDGSLGFAAGVMVAASYWSLLAPAIEMAEESELYGSKGEYAFIPVAIGFFLGALFVYGADLLISHLGIASPVTALALQTERKLRREDSSPPTDTTRLLNGSTDTTTIEGFSDNAFLQLKRRGGGATAHSSVSASQIAQQNKYSGSSQSEQLSLLSVEKSERWKRILLLIVAITVHNIPEGLAVGVGFGAIGKSASATFENARNLAIGIGIQNFPEGLAVSLPLRAAGFSTFTSFWYGQLSGMVEPIFGILGAAGVTLVEPILPYSLAFAAGAMIYVVLDDIVPEAHSSGNGKLATWGAVCGFVVMMALDVGLG